MLTSLLSLYIFTKIGANILQDTTPNADPSAIIRLATSNIHSLIQSNPIPVKKAEYISPIISPKSAMAIDLKSGAILYEKKAHSRLPIASITKLMTILIIMEENNLDDIVTVSANAAKTDGSTMFLSTGEQITVKNLMYGAIIHSANDAATALAEYNAGSVEKFVEKMNTKALKLGLLNTHYSNPVGLDWHDNYSSAYDLAKLAKYIYQKKFIQEAAVIREMSVTSVDGKFTHKLSSTNELLGMEDGMGFKFKGLKTGSTDAAGLCLVTIAENDKGNEIITVLLNSPDRFKETKILADWTFRAYNW